MHETHVFGRVFEYRSERNQIRSTTSLLCSYVSGGCGGDVQTLPESYRIVYFKCWMNVSQRRIRIVLLVVFLFFRLPTGIFQNRLSPIAVSLFLKENPKKPNGWTHKSTAVVLLKKCLLNRRYESVQKTVVWNNYRGKKMSRRYHVKDDLTVSIHWSNFVTLTPAVYFWW